MDRETPSSSDEDVSCPSVSECDRRCREFAEITQTDTACAMFFLQDVEWDLDKALSAYFAMHHTADDALIRNQASSNRKDNMIKLLSWNLNGLDKKCLADRADGVLELVNRESPDIIFFQELVPYTLDRFSVNLPGYKVFSGLEEDSTDQFAYFTAILARKATCSAMTSEIIPFTNTLMLRNLLQVDLTVRDIPLTVMTTHLESTAEHADARKDQLRLCFQTMKQIESARSVIFGGDLNLRDSELTAVGLPSGIVDVWQDTGSRAECRYTWDPQRNTLITGVSKYVRGLRFDRLFFRPSQAKELEPVYFELEGLEYLPRTRVHMSDHWAIQAYFDICKTVRRRI